MNLLFNKKRSLIIISSNNFASLSNFFYYMRLYIFYFASEFYEKSLFIELLSFYFLIDFNDYDSDILLTIRIYSITSEVLILF
jgi:hypothetical protein